MNKHLKYMQNKELNYKKNLVYLGISADIFHHGHINIITKAKKFGRLVIGLLTDEAVSEKKRIPMLNWEQRYQNSFNNISNLTFTNKGSLQNFSKISKYQVNDNILISDNNIIYSDYRGNIGVYSLSENKLIYYDTR